MHACNNNNSSSNHVVGSLRAWASVLKNSVTNSSATSTPTSTTATEAPLVSSRRVLVWGKKRGVQISLQSFAAVRKGKTADCARRNAAPSNRILSLVTLDPNHPSLDIEAPTQPDRSGCAVGRLGLKFVVDDGSRSLYPIGGKRVTESTANRRTFRNRLYCSLRHYFLSCMQLRESKTNLSIISNRSTDRQDRSPNAKFSMTTDILIQSTLLLL